MFVRRVVALALVAFASVVVAAHVDAPLPVTTGLLVHLAAEDAETTAASSTQGNVKQLRSRVGGWAWEQLDSRYQPRLVAAGEDSAATAATAAASPARAVVRFSDSTAIGQFESTGTYLAAQQPVVRPNKGGLHVFLVAARDGPLSATRYQRLVSTKDAESADDWIAPSWVIEGPRDASGNAYPFALRIIELRVDVDAGDAAVTIERMTLGAKYNDPRAHAAYDFGELLVYDAPLDCTDRNLVLGHLRARWGISAEPPRTDGLVLWLDAMDGWSLNEDADRTLRSWRDKSASCADARAPSIEAQPKIAFDSANLFGHTGVAFDGHADYLDVGTLRAATGGYHYFVVFARPNPGANTYQRLLSSWNGNRSLEDFMAPNWIAHVPWVGNVNELHGREAAIDRAFVLSDGRMALADESNFVIDNFKLGAQPELDPSRRASMIVGEVLVFDHFLVAADASAVHTWLEERWGISAPTPAPAPTADFSITAPIITSPPSTERPTTGIACCDPTPGTAGCDGSPTREQCVCDVDPYCCDPAGEWDMFCVRQVTEFHCGECSTPAPTPLPYVQPTPALPPVCCGADAGADAPTCNELVPDIAACVCRFDEYCCLEHGSWDARCAYEVGLWHCGPECPADAVNVLRSTTTADELAAHDAQRKQKHRAMRTARSVFGRTVYERR